MKKYLAILLCLVMVLGCLVGCAKTETKQEEAPKQEETKKEEPKKEEPKKEETKQEDTKTTEEPKQEEVDTRGQLPLVPEGEKKVITIGTPADPKTEDYDTNEFTLWLEEQTGIDIQFVLFSNDKSEYTTQINAMIAAGEKLPDILSYIQLGNSMMYQLGEDGYLLDIQDYFEKYGYWFWQAYDEAVKADGEAMLENVFTYQRDPSNGAIYSYPDYSPRQSVDHLEYAVSVNNEWLDKVGKKAPTTIDELYDVLVAFRDYGDINGDGLENDIPLFGNYTGSRADITEWIINAYVFCCDTHRFNATDGKIWVPYTTDEYREALKFMNKLYAEGLMSPLQFSGLQNADVKPMIAPNDGKSVSSIGVFGGYPTVFMPTDSEEVRKFSALAPLADETGKGGYGALMGPAYNFYTYITTDAEDPVLCFKLLDFMNSVESTNFQRYGVKGRDWQEAPEGSVSSFGTPAKIVDINGVFSGQGNAVWHLMRSAILPSTYNASAYTDDGSISAHRAMLNKAQFDNFKTNAKLPAEVVMTVIYNAEEQETVSEVSSVVNSYIDEARALFIAGALDPNSDADWQTYLDNLQAQGLDRYIAVTQTAYTRMKG